MATITGNPQNMLIGGLSHIDYRTFLGRLGPVALFGLAVDSALLCWMFRRDLRPGALEHAGRGPRAIHRAMMAKALSVSLGVLIGFLAGADPAIVAASGAAVLILTRRVKPEKIYGQIDWGLLMLFVGLFVVVAGAERAGLADWFFEWLRPIGLERVGSLSLVAALLSNLISNVPAVMLLAKLVPQLPDPETSWLTLAMASTLAGNLTLLGSIANLIVLEGARKQGHTITFLDYLRVGAPVTLLTLAFGIWWLS